jgi:hypothetical protein
MKDDIAVGADESEDLSDTDLQAIEAMRKATPDARANAGEDEPSRPDTAEPELPLDGGKNPEPKADPDAEAELDEEVDPDEITLDGAGRARDASGKYVPKAAYLRVKEQRKADRSAAQAATERAIKAETRFATLAEIIDAQPDPTDTKPAAKTETNPWDDADIDETIDPLGALRQDRARAKYDRAQAQEKIAALEGQLQESARAGSVRNTEMAVYEAFKRDVVAFQSKEPAFEQALGHLVGVWKSHMKLMGETDDAKMDQAVAQTQRGILHKALANKTSPSKIMFDMAVSTGFKAQAVGAVDGEPQVSDAAKRIQRTQQNMQANRTLSGAGGGAPAADGSAAALLAMSDEEFSDFADTERGRATLKKLGMLG